MIVLTLATLVDAILIVILSNDILLRVILLNELMLKVRVLGCPTLLSVTLPNGVRTNAVVPFPDFSVCVFAVDESVRNSSVLSLRQRRRKVPRRFPQEQQRYGCVAQSSFHTRGLCYKTFYGCNGTM